MADNQNPHAWRNPDLVRNFVTGVRARLPLAQEQLDVMSFVLRRALPDVGRFLDVGCGSGLLSQVLRSSYPHAEAVLVDYSEPMLDIARQNFTDDQTHIYHRDMSKADWLDAVRLHAPYDAIVSGYAIHHLTHERKRALYAEIYSLLRAGGVFINIEHVASPSEWVEDLFNHAFAGGIYAMYAEQGNPRELDEILINLHKEDGDICATTEEQCDWLRAIGFQHVDTYMKIYALAVFGGIKPT